MNPDQAKPLEINEALLIFHFEKTLILPDNPIALLRGMLGRALANRFHPRLPRNAPEEDIPPDSPYWPLFKPRPAQGGRERPPYLFECPWGAGPANALHVRLRTFGGSREEASVYLQALRDRAPAGLGEHGLRTPCEMEWVESPPPAQPPALPGATPRAIALEYATPAQLTVKFDAPAGKIPLDELFFQPRAAAPVFLGRAAEPLPLLAYASALSAAKALRELGGSLPDIGEPLSHALHAAAHDTTRYFRASLARYDNPGDEAAGRQSVCGLMGRLELMADPLLAWCLEWGALLGVGRRVSHGCGRIRVHPLS